METGNGALAFDVFIRDNDLNAMLSKDERRIAEFTQNVESNSDSIVGSFDNIGKAVGGIAVGAMLKSWVQDIISVRGEFQQLEIAFTTMLGSAEKSAALMQQVTETAATTPFDLKGVANGAKQLLAYGESADRVNDTLVRLGNIASGLSLPLNDIVYLYGTTMVQGRLFTQDVRQFMGRGIPLVQELSKELGKTTEEINQMVTDGKIGFPEVQKVIANLTNEGGMFYNLMAEQSKSLTGQIANLGDAWDMMLNDMGSKSEGILSGGISLATTLVENYEDVVRVIEAIVVAYGSYKAACLTLAIAQKRSTGFASIDNIVLKARTGQLTSLTAITQNYTKQHGLMTASQRAYTAELQKALSVEQQEQLLINIKTAAIQQLLTEEQNLYMSRLQLTAGTREYLVAAEQLLTADQQAALSKLNLTREGNAYAMAVENTVKSIQHEQSAQLAQLRVEAAALKQKQKNLQVEYRASLNKIEQTRVQIALAKAEGNAEAVAALQEKQHTQLKEHQNIVSTMKSTKLAQEAATQKIATIATQQASVAGKQKAASDVLQTTTTSLLSKGTTFLIAKLKALWATMLANPITAIISIVGALASAMLLLGDDTDDAKDSLERFGESGEKQASSIETLVAVLKAGTKGSNTWKKALEQLNEKLAEHNMQLLGEKSSIEEIEEAQRKLTATIKKESVERERANALGNVEEEYRDALDKIGKTIETELKEAHHYDWFWGLSFDSDDIQSKATALAGQIRGIIEDGLQDMVNLPDDKKAEAKDKLRQQITDVMTAAGIEKSHAEFITDYSWLDNMYYDVFSEKGGIIDQALEAREAFEGQKKAANEAADAIANAAMAEGGLADASEEAVPKVDLSKYSLEELHKMADQLSGTEISLDIKLYGYAEAKAMLADIQAEIGKQQGSLNTENGINDEVKRVKALRSEAIIGSAAWNSYNEQITALEARLPKTGRSAESAAEKAKRAAEKRQKAAEDAANKELELTISLEESRLAIIKDGYEKRVKELEVQHRKELERIEKEKRELEKAYKEAGKAMPADSVAKFAEMTDNENARYAMEMQGLTDVEIEEKKKAYELYYKWVSTYGLEVANAQYQKLVADGNTYTEWLEGKVRALTELQAQQGNLSEADSNRLITYQAELNGVKGVKTEMEKFNEALSKAKDNTDTLQQYMAKLVQMKQDLQTGKTGLIGEERAEAIRRVDEQIQQSTEQLQKQLLQTYKSNAQLRLETETRYEEEITWLRQHGYEEQAQLAERAKVKALAEIDQTKIQATDDWRELFANAQYLSGKAFDAIIERLRKMVAEIEDVDIKNAITKQLDDLEKQTQGSKNPFKMLVKSIKEYKAAGDDAVEKKKSLVKMFDSISDAADMVKGSFDAVVDGLKQLGLAGDEETQTMLGNISDMIGGASQLAKGMATGNPVDIISGGVSLVTSAISLFDSTSRRIKREMKEHEKQLRALQGLYNQVSWEVDNAVGDDYYRKQYEKIENLQKQAQEYDELARLEASKKSKDRDDAKVDEYKEAAAQARRDIEDAKKEIAETLTQTNFKDLANDMADAWAEAFGKMDDAAENFDKLFKQTVANAVKNSLKLKLLEPTIKRFTDALSAHMAANNFSANGFNFEYWKRELKTAGDNFGNALQEFADFFEDADDKVDTLEGNIKGVSEETASALAGEITAMRIRQAAQLISVQNIERTMQAADATLVSCLTQLNTIARNTQPNSSLYEIRNYLRDMHSTMQSDPLRAKGYDV